MKKYLLALYSLAPVCRNWPISASSQPNLQISVVAKNASTGVSENSAWRDIFSRGRG